MSTTEAHDQLTALPFATGIVLQPSKPLEEAARLAQESGCTHVYVEGAYSSDGVAAWTTQRVDEASMLLADRGLAAVFHANYKNPLSHPVPEIRRAAVDYAQREVELAAALGCPIIVHGSAVFEHGDPKQVRDKARQAFAASVQAVAERAGEADVELWIENLENYAAWHPFHTVFSSAEDYAFVLEAVPSARFTLDVGHDNLSGPTSVETFRRFSDRIVAIDVNDNEGSTDTHSRLGTGTLQFRELLEAIHELGWRGLLTFETRDVPVADGVSYLAELWSGIVER